MIAVGWRMLMQKDSAPAPAREHIAPQDEFRQAFHPLTLPLTVGPGSISVAITLGANSTHRHRKIIKELRRGVGYSSWPLSHPRMPSTNGRKPTWILKISRT